MRTILFSVLIVSSISLHQAHSMSSNHISAGLCFFGSWVFFLSSLNYAQKLGVNSPNIPTMLEGLGIFGFGSSVALVYSLMGAKILNNV